MKIRFIKSLAVVIAMAAGSSAFGQDYYAGCEGDIETVSFLGGDACQKGCDDDCGKGGCDYGILDGAGGGDRGWRASVDALVLSRTDAEDQTLFDDVINGGEAFNATDLGFGVDAGWRVNITRETGRSWDFEAIYAYLPFEENNSVVGDTNNFNTRFAGFVGFSDVDAFDTRYFSQTHSVELNARRTSDCYPVTVLAGFRYADLAEHALIQADAGAGIVDILDTKVANHLYGGQLGIEAVLLTRKCWDIDIHGKAGVFGVHSSQSTFAQEPFGIDVQSDFGSRNDVALIAELGVNGRVQLTNCVALRAGFMLLWLEGVALAPDQWNDIDFSVPTSNVIDNGGGFLAYGGVFGIEGTW